MYLTNFCKRPITFMEREDGFDEASLSEDNCEDNLVILYIPIYLDIDFLKPHM